VDQAGEQALRRFRFADRSGGDIYRPGAGARMHELACSPDGEWLAFALQRNAGKKAEALLAVPVRGGEERVLMSVRNGSLSGAEWSRRGDSLYVSTPDDPTPRLWRVSLDGGMPEKLPLEVKRVGGIRLHPDGRRFAYEVNEERNEVWALEGLARPAKGGRAEGGPAVSRRD
ncbi:MAG: hypothetical protein GY953_09890, partial [bacterium]|nr:hypothetical protein [bacterium]